MSMIVPDGEWKYLWECIAAVIVTPGAATAKELERARSALVGKVRTLDEDALRDRFAGQIAAGLAATGRLDDNIAGDAYILAEQMLKERKAGR